MNFARSPIDQEIIRMVRAGSEPGYELLYQTYSAPVYGLLVRITSNPDSACRLLPGIFAGICRDIHEYDGRLGFSTWIMNRARKACADQVSGSRSPSAAGGPASGLLELIYGKCLSVHDAARHFGLTVEEAMRRLRDELISFKQQRS